MYSNQITAIAFPAMIHFQSIAKENDDYTRTLKSHNGITS